MSWLTQLLSSFAKPLKWWIVIAPWERGVRVRLGRSAVELRPGPHLRIPFLDRIYVQSVRLRTVLETNQVASTLDGKVLNVSFGVRFQVADPVRLYESVINPEVTVTGIVQGEVMRVICETTCADLTVTRLEQAVNARLGEVASWGLADVRFFVTGYAFVRAYRILNTDYRTSAGLCDIEKESNER